MKYMVSGSCGYMYACKPSTYSRYISLIFLSAFLSVLACMCTCLLRLFPWRTMYQESQYTNQCACTFNTHSQDAL